MGQLMGIESLPRAGEQPEDFSPSGASNLLLADRSVVARTPIMWRARQFSL